MLPHRPHTKAEKKVKGQRSKEWWASPSGQKQKRLNGARMAEWNTTRIFSEETLRRASERLTHINKTRTRSEKERQDISNRMKKAHLEGNGPRRGPLTDLEKAAHRARLLAHPLKSPPMSDAAKESSSKRMRENNPMWRPDVAARAGKTRSLLHREQMSIKAKELRASGSFIRRSPISNTERARISERMLANNPMKNPLVVAKVIATRAITGSDAIADRRMRQTWAEGKITSAHRRMAGGRRTINKSEAKLLAIIGPLG